MSQKKKDTDTKQTIDMDAVATLSIINALQFFYVLIRGAYLVAALGLFSIWRGGAVCARFIGVMAWRGMSGTVRAIDAVAGILARVLSWIIVSFVWVVWMVVRMLCWRVWGTAVFVCYRIPKYIVILSCRALVFIAQSFAHVCSGCVTAVAAVPGDILDTVQNARESFALPVGWTKRMTAFIAVALLFILPFPAIQSFQFLTDVRADTQRESIEALLLLEQGKDALARSDAVKAESLFSRSYTQFLEAEKGLSSVPGTVRSAAQFIPFAGQKIGDGERLIAIGKNLARAGVIASDVARKFSETSGDPEHFFMALSAELDSISEAFAFLADADVLVSHIDGANIPAMYRERFTALSAQLHAVVEAGNQILPSRDALLRVLGSAAKRRYLVVFQNNTELRPTGGFIGSYALIDVLRGKLVTVEIPGGGSYDLQGSLTQRVQSPLPLRIVNASWQFQDSNWFPDFPTSARNMIWFYEKSGGPTVDGVIAINASFFEKLLGIIGTVDMPSYGKTLTADNFMLETQKSVELEYDKTENRPKQFIADLFPKTLEKMETLEGSARSAFSSALIEAFVARDIQVYFRDTEEEHAIKQFGIGGAMRTSPLDYFSIVQANVGGGKGEGVIDEEIERTTVFRQDGRIEVRVRIRRTHHGKIGDPFGGTRNISYVRIYLPKGTQGIFASGFAAPDQSLFKPVPQGYAVPEALRAVEGVPLLDPATGMVATTEYGKSVFAHWMILEPGQETVAEAAFLLPFAYADIPKGRDGKRLYTVLIQRQSGATTKKFTSSFRGKGADQSFVFDPFSKDEVVGLTLHD
ncbi:DUF4012 domain-containing protein [Candidatus Uhrbacteria bacterium]|nr:DUF4012 domain-containing protein [Candidatus Uhrbacteria bacterium]